MNIELPWPAAGLSPNDRGRWQVKHQASKKARLEGGLCALAAGAHLVKFKDVAISVTFHPKTKNAFDIDNAIARLKPYLDGIADVIKVDDSTWAWRTLTKGEPVKGGKVLINITGHAE